MADLKFSGISYEAVLEKYADTVTGVCVMRLCIPLRKPQLHGV